MLFYPCYLYGFQTYPSFGGRNHRGMRYLSQEMGISGRQIFCSQKRRDLLFQKSYYIRPRYDSGR